MKLRRYMKYNAVLRSKSGDEFLLKQYEELCHGNNYVSTIHAVNSCVIKLSKLTTAGKIWRGVCYGVTPSSFWTPSAEGICGGVEFGFQSMSRSYANAEYYACGCGVATMGEDATTLFELQMGLVDRGADLTWLSQVCITALHQAVHLPVHMARRPALRSAANATTSSSAASFLAMVVHSTLTRKKCCCRHLPASK